MSLISSINFFAFCVNSEQNLFPADWLSTYLFFSTRHLFHAGLQSRHKPPSVFFLPRMLLSAGLPSLRHPPDLPTPASGLFFLPVPHSMTTETLVTRTRYWASLNIGCLVGDCWRSHSSQLLT